MSRKVSFKRGTRARRERARIAEKLKARKNAIKEPFAVATRIAMRRELKRRRLLALKRARAVRRMELMALRRRRVMGLKKARAVRARKRMRR